jgi:hypothetical protein
MAAKHDSLESELIRAVELLADTFASQSIHYALIGGLATVLRGRPRFTQDIDILLDVPQISLPTLLDELARIGFLFDRDTVIREYVREHMTVLRFGSDPSRNGLRVVAPVPDGTGSTNRWLPSGQSTGSAGTI